MGVFVTVVVGVLVSVKVEVVVPVFVRVLVMVGVLIGVVVVVKVAVGAGGGLVGLGGLLPQAIGIMPDTDISRIPKIVRQSNRRIGTSSKKTI